MKVTAARLLCAVLLLAVAARLRPATAGRDEAGLDVLPPQVALASVALGGLNGLIADFLWLRTSQQQDRGEYFEMAQTAAWIAALEPRLGGVYDFQAWNMAYNLSVEFDDPADRWRWIQRGLRLLLDEGLARNPDDPDVYRALAEIIVGKVADYLDDDHFIYKRLWADEWTWILGGARPDFDALARAPDEAALAADPQVQMLVQRAAAQGVDLVAQAYLLTRPGATPPPEVAALLADPARQDGLRKVLRHARARRLREVWKMDLTRLRRVDRQFGPLDWRTGQAHGLYWALLAVEKNGGRGKDLPLERLIYQTLWSAFQRGRLVYAPGAESIFPSPDMRLIPVVERELQRILSYFPDDQNLRAAWRTFASDAVVYLYANRRVEEARTRYDKLRAAFPDEADFRQPFDQFVLAATGQMAAGDLTEVTALIEGFLRQACLFAAAGDDEQATGFEALAKLIYTRYQRDMEGLAGQSLPPFAALRSGAVTETLELGLAPQLAARLRARGAR